MTEATQLVTYDHHQTKRDWLTIQNPAIELANAIAGTEFVPTHFRNNPAAIAAAILYGDEVGLGPMQSLAKIAVINGRPTLAAEAQRALILQAGHDLWIEETTASRCTICGRRRGSDATSRITWTIDDAKRAQLSGKPPWRLYPRQMLLARASAELARAVFPDAIGGLASTEEIDDGAAIGGGTAEAATPTTRRRRANVTATPDPGPAPVDEKPADPAPVVQPDDDPTNPGDVIDVDAIAEAEAIAEASADRDPELAPISDGQRRKIQAMFREAGIVDRQARLDYCSAQTGREIGTANDLTFSEAGALIEHLEAAREASRGVDDPPPEPGLGQLPVEYATADQREALFDLRMAKGISDFRLREILQAVTGQQLTAQIPAALYQAVVDEINLQDTHPRD